MVDDMRVYIANLGKYNEGELVGDELLSEALQELSEEERFILLLYGLGFNDGEIADLLKIVRRTVNYKRQRGFEKVRKRMEEKQHEE